MAHELRAREGERYLVPRLVVARLNIQFAYVEADEEYGRRHVGALIGELSRIVKTGVLPLDTDYVDRLKRSQHASIYICFGDDPSSEVACLNTVVIPGEPLHFDYPSKAHEQAAHSLLVRCAKLMGYEIIDV
jgi:hypothetical protein